MKKSKKLISLILCLTLCFSLCVSAGAVNSDSTRAVIGADLSGEQIDSVYSSFGVERGNVTELTVTNSEEREWLDGVVSSDKIGTRSISCVYIELTEDDSGLNIETNNINWCTEAIYKNALTTAGVYDANVIIAAPFAVSGTAALTGIYKAYEDMTGEDLSQAAKETAVEELVVTSSIADAVGDVDAAGLVNELKLILDDTAAMTDEELREEILYIAERCNVQLTDEQIQQLIDLVRKLEKLDTNVLVDKVKDIQAAVKKFAEVEEGASGFFVKVRDFIAKILDFFSGLFK